MGQLTVDNISADLHFAVTVSAESARRLHQVVVHDPQDAKVGVLRIVVLGKGEVKA